MKAPIPIVFVIDDDRSVRRAIQRLVKSVGLRVEVFSSAQEFLASTRPLAPSCLVREVRLRGTSEADFQRNLRQANINIPTIYIAAHGDIRTAVRVMKSGAVEFLPKPFRDQELVEAIQSALKRDRAERELEIEVEALRKSLESLTPRELQVVTMVVSGMPNKLIGDQIGISENTVKAHRSRAMSKVHATSLPDLVRIFETIITYARRAA
jgi:RNA polymerase sigma factor (sigma-70 family)